MKILLLSIAFFALSIPAAADEDTLPDKLDDLMISAQPDNLESAGVTDESSESELIYPMSPERKEKLISYSRFKNIWRFAIFFIDVIILGAILYIGLSGRFQRWSEAISRRKSLVRLIYFLFFWFFLNIVYLPINYYRGFVIEHDYGFSNQTFAQWLGEGLKGFGVGLVFALIVVLILYWLINRFRRWWLYFAFGSIPFLIVVIVIFPAVVSPLFNKFEPIKDRYLAEEMTLLAEKAGIHDPDIYEVDASKQSKKINAYFTGMFGTKRIVLYDNIINNFTVDEIRYVMGHEIGHYVMNHIWKGLSVAVLLIFIACYLINRLLHRAIERNSHRFGFRKLGDIASLPLLMLFVTVFFFVVQPISNGISRQMEYHADEYGLKLSGVSVEVATTTFDKLSVYNLSDPEPSPIIEFWFYDHPCLKKRINNIKKLYGEIQSSS